VETVASMRARLAMVVAGFATNVNVPLAMSLMA